MAIRGISPPSVIKLSDPDYSLQLELGKVADLIQAVQDSLRFEELKAEFINQYPRGIDDPAFI